MQELEHEIANFDKVRDQRIKAAQAKIKAAKSELEAAKKALKAAQQALQSANAEAESAAVERGALAQQLAAAEELIKGRDQSRQPVKPAAHARGWPLRFATSAVRRCIPCLWGCGALAGNAAGTWTSRLGLLRCGHAVY
jgi:multidrug efflux pump subunit AcrA (membrane-fusion protein)